MAAVTSPPTALGHASDTEQGTGPAGPRSMGRVSTATASPSRRTFLVSTPFQFIVATLIAPQEPGPYRILVVTDFAESLRQIASLAATLGERNYQVMSVPAGRGRMLSRLANEARLLWRLRRVRSRLSANDRVLIGFHLYAANRPFLFQRRCPVELFDEGTATIAFLRARAAGQTKIDFPRPTLSTIYTALYPRSVALERLRFHTIYPGLSGGQFDEVVPVAPQLPEALTGRKALVREVWVIGSPLVQMRFVTAHRWEALVQVMRRASSEAGLRLVYFPHRTERIDASLADVELRRPDTPFEVFFGLSRIRPAAVLSVASSAALNQQLFFNGSGAVALVDPEDPEMTPRIGDVHEYGRAVLGMPVLRPAQLHKFLVDSFSRAAAAT